MYLKIKIYLYRCVCVYSPVKEDVVSTQSLSKLEKAHQDLCFPKEAPNPQILRLFLNIRFVNTIILYWGQGGVFYFTQVPVCLKKSRHSYFIVLFVDKPKTQIIMVRIVFLKTQLNAFGKSKNGIKKYKNFRVLNALFHKITKMSKQQ